MTCQNVQQLVMIWRVDINLVLSGHCQLISSMAVSEGRTESYVLVVDLLDVVLEDEVELETLSEANCALECHGV